MLVFSKGWFDGRRIDLFALLMALAIVVDYGAWLRLMLSGRTFVSMWRPLWFIAIPLAVFPVLAFGFAALWGRSPLLGVAAVVLAIGHWAVSWNTYVQLT